MLLAPCSARIPASFHRKETNRNRYWSLLDQMQRLRGQVYLQDGAIDASALTDGRHQSEIDLLSWHLLVLNGEGAVRGGARFHEHPGLAVTSDLKAARCALAESAEWSGPVQAALETELMFSRDLDVPCVEVGGWALGEEIRGTTEALRMALAAYALWEGLGSAVCISTATRRNCSASILRRIGGRLLKHEGRELPPYFDPQYNCEMELLGFYSWAPNPRYAVWVNQMKKDLSQIPIVVAHPDLDEWSNLSKRSVNSPQFSSAQPA